jgi:hypothetical protein
MEHRHMSYLICPSFADADAISARVASEQGCTGDVTARWFEVMAHPTDGRAAFAVSDGDAGNLTSDEQAALVASLTADWTAS